MHELVTPLGAYISANNRCRFRLWAPQKKRVQLHIVSPAERRVPMKKIDADYFEAEISDCPADTLYFYILDDGNDLPDPASHHQPQGVHGPSAVVDQRTYPWSDQSWNNHPLQKFILYELHVGTFTEEGTFEAIIPRLDTLKDLGVNAIEIMPIAQFPGSRNWGYDGVFPYAVQHSYGGPDGLKNLVDACHNKGIAVILDVVYNHLGPEGNYFTAYGPYFTAAYQTPWGEALNFDGPWSDGVRDFFADNALHWFRHYHIDGLRLDAIHAILDNGAVHVLQYMNEKIDRYIQHTGKTVYMIAESDLNAPRVIQNFKTGGYGFDAQWLDDFHHALFVLLYPEGKERYEDFGTMEQLAKAYTEGFVHSGEYVNARRRKYGASSAGVLGSKFVVFVQNHDQVGNYKNGDRLTHLVSDVRLRIAAAALLLSPYIPMLFMGEEYGEERPFLYFTSHDDPELAAQVRAGRQQEFEHFLGSDPPPDPQAESTFQSCILDWSIRTHGKHGRLLEWYKNLIALRRKHPALQNFNKADTQIRIIGSGAWALIRQDESKQSQLLALFNLSDRPVPFAFPPNSTWTHLLDSTAASPTDTATTGPDGLTVPPVSVWVLATKA